MVSPTTTSHPAQRPEIERILDDYNVEWEFDPSLSFDQVDEKRSLSNQARVDQPIMPDLLETYAEAMRQGDEFPAIVVHKDGPKYVTVDGNHRLVSGKKVGKTEFPAYKVKARAETIRVLMTLLNVIHGRALSEKEKLWHAFFLIDAGTSQEKAAEVLRLPLGRLRTAWALEMANRRAREVGIRGKAWNDLPQSVRARLAQVSTDAGFRAAFDLAAKAELSGPEVSKIVTEVNKQRSEHGQAQVIDEASAALTTRIQTTAGGTIRREVSPKHQLRMHLAAVAKINLDTVPALCTDEEATQVAEVCMAASEALTKLADRLTARV